MRRLARRTGARHVLKERMTFEMLLLILVLFILLVIVLCILGHELLPLRRLPRSIESHPL
ncbi:hypothetical protein O9H85_00890 [Paenibacillus filicis]|uniref:Uncharacterized protein n=1 Tax=Paenibacillus gyeongsangnamensis TaxID=3388067 RepID=A0ABT4Q2M2_9BACL|nr:hypothetical protein [Paenibacillus filicis]MCZ8511012.1 hypothetical protein [Paenibacillus filicis]